MSRFTTKKLAAALAQTIAIAALPPATGQAIAASAQECSLLRQWLTDTQTAKYTLAQQHCDGDDVPEPSPTRRPHAAQLRLFETSLAVILVPSFDPTVNDQGPPQWVPQRPKGPSALIAADVTKRAIALAPDIDATARQHDIDPLLLHAIAHVESRHNTNAVSPAGALGLMQVMPATAQRFGVSKASELHDARTNLNISATYLKKLQTRFGNDLPLVLAAYNAGEGAVEKYGRNIPPYKETQNYVREVLARYSLLSTASKQADTTVSRSK
jgi:lysozyme